MLLLPFPVLGGLDEMSERTGGSKGREGNAALLLIQKIEQLAGTMAKTKLKVSKMRLGP